MKQRRDGKLTTPSNHQEAHKGYLLTVSPFNGTVSIKRDGYHIAYASSIEEARHIVSLLV